MNRCIDCDGLLMKEEKICQICGAEVPQPPKMDASNVISYAVQGLFVAALTAMITSLFSEGGPGFITSLLLACALMIVARSLKDRPQSVTKKR
jgi:hypothetical protein